MNWFQKQSGISALITTQKVIIDSLDVLKQGNDARTLTINEIRNQLTTNGGKTIKDDMVWIKNELTGQNARMLDFIALSVIPTFVSDSKGACIAVNQALMELFGASREQMLGFGWINFLIDTEKNQKRVNWENAVKYDDFIKDRYHIINGKTQKIIYCEYAANFTRGKMNEVISIMGTVTEIKE